jgi:hypothetical protein
MGIGIGCVFSVATRGLGVVIINKRGAGGLETSDRFLKEIVERKQA